MLHTEDFASVDLSEVPKLKLQSEQSTALHMPASKLLSRGVSWTRRIETYLSYITKSLKFTYSTEGRKEDYLLLSLELANCKFFFTFVCI